MFPTNILQALLYNLINSLFLPSYSLVIFSFSVILIISSTWYCSAKNKIHHIGRKKQNIKAILKPRPKNPRSYSRIDPNISRKRRTSMSTLESKCLRRTSIFNSGSTGGWSTLPADLLLLVVDRLVVEEDFIAFRAVCKSWRAAVPKSYWKRVPWLLSKKYENSTVVLKGLSSLSQSNGLKSLFQTELSWRYWGSFTGWILGQNQLDYRLQLINPLTKAVIDLPQLHYPISKGLIYESRGSYSGEPVIEIMAISHRYSGIAMINVKHQEWTFLEDSQPKSNFVDLVWYNDHVLAIRANGTIVVFDDAGVAAVSFTPPQDKVGDHNALYLVESSGDLLIIVQRHVILFGRHFELYKLDFDTGGWIQVTDLGRQSLFVGESYSLSYRINDDRDDTWQRSCIYYTTYNPISEQKLLRYNTIKRQMEFHYLGHVADLNRCYDFVWFMPAVGSK